jgi:homoserine dehydrogenase
MLCIICQMHVFNTPVNVHTSLPTALHCTLQNPGVHFAYEAAVCGGIPIINALQNDFFGDKITKICGIMNGTTNFMLSKMEGEGAAYDAVLKEAQVCAEQTIAVFFAFVSQQYYRVNDVQ